jgi:hypothetical protein
MKRPEFTNRRVGVVLCGTLAAVLAGCTTYVEHRHPVVVTPPPATPPVVITPPATPPVVVTPAPAEPPVVVIQAETDFYEPLSPHGEWVVVGSYGRCWRPTRVAVGWRPYCDGYWRRTDAGWYWVSDEPWGWATYHYGRWDWSVQFGWIWVPQTRWAPAWVSWRHGAGYVGWAPLPPSARISMRGDLEVRETSFAPRAYVFVSEQRLLEPVRPTTVIANNTTIINQTVNITKVQVVNQTVINEGPRPEIIERRSGRKIEAVPVRELRHHEETEVVKREHIAPARPDKRDQTPAVTPAPVAPPRATPARGPAQVRQPPETARQPQAPGRRNENVVTRQPEPSPTPARPAVETPARIERRPDERRGNAGPVATPPATLLEKKSSPTDRPGEVRRNAPAPEGPKPPAQPANANKGRGSDEMKSPSRPVRPTVEKPMGNERQRELAPGRSNPKTAPATNKPAEVKKKDEKKKDEKNKDEQSESPPRRPSRQPR